MRNYNFQVCIPHWTTFFFSKHLQNLFLDLNKILCFVITKGTIKLKKKLAFDFFRLENYCCNWNVLIELKNFQKLINLIEIYFKIKPYLFLPILFRLNLVFWNWSNILNWIIIICVHFPISNWKGKIQTYFVI